MHPLLQLKSVNHALSGCGGVHGWGNACSHALRSLLLLPLGFLMAARAPHPDQPVAVRTHEEGAAIYKQACAMCHGAAGEGRLPYGTALAGSLWLASCREEQLMAIILDGVHGEIHGSKAPYPVMAALRNWLTDNQTADVSRYTLAKWAARESALDWRAVRLLRDMKPVRQMPWPVDELDKVPFISNSQTSADRKGDAP